ncbi:MAG: cell division protein FtsZ [Aigarchaeota archaeon]|nr:cell division protein FtsZ [Aigarchaeota archaeon]MDW8093250.1 cell division protein FtsZ [Nitrososphaerota archaeon]
MDDFADHRMEDVIVKIVGLGGAGCNTINRLFASGIQSALTIAANTDKQHLDTIKAHHKVLLGKSVTRQKGTGGNPEIGRRATEESLDEITQLLSGADIVFISAGLGGGTGTGAAPVVAKVARDLGAIVVGVATLPFRFEGSIRRKVALRGLEELQNSAHTVVVVDNNRLLDLYPQYSLNTAFSLADEVIKDMVLSITESIVRPSLINIDYEDFKTIAAHGKLASLGIGRSSSPNRAEEATFNALQSPLVDGYYEKIASAIVHVTGGEDMKLKEASRPAEIISELMGEEGLIIWGARVDSYIAPSLQVALVLTGISSGSLMDQNGSRHAQATTPYESMISEGNHVTELPATQNQPELGPLTQVDASIDDELERIMEELGIKRPKVSSVV